MKIPCIDVTREAELAGYSAALVALSGGARTFVDSAGPELVGAFVRVLLERPDLARQPLDDHTIMVTSPKGQRFVLAFGRTDAGRDAVAIIGCWEWALARGRVEPDVFHLETPEFLQ